ncbi:MAG: hypothetical protein JRK53_16190 [Deltaproteobacteria bacterium]|nr:hypothetical protein [Deltaproteobacteria bacterium]MBW1817911.1 hypothetical protein [Deltaproteobacteria bacterium]
MFVEVQVKINTNIAKMAVSVNEKRRESDRYKRKALFSEGRRRAGYPNFLDKTAWNYIIIDLPLFLRTTLDLWPGKRYVGRPATMESTVSRTPFVVYGQPTRMP